MKGLCNARSWARLDREGRKEGGGGGGGGGGEEGVVVAETVATPGPNPGGETFPTSIDERHLHHNSTQKLAACSWKIEVANENRGPTTRIGKWPEQRENVPETEREGMITRAAYVPESRGTVV